MKVKSLSRVRLLGTSWTAAYQAPPSMGFSRQEYWSGVPLPSPMVTLGYGNFNSVQTNTLNQVLPLGRQTSIKTPPRESRENQGRGSRSFPRPELLRWGGHGTPDGAPGWSSLSPPPPPCPVRVLSLGGETEKLRAWGHSEPEKLTQQWEHGPEVPLPPNSSWSRAPKRRSPSPSRTPVCLHDPHS